MLAEILEDRRVLRRKRSKVINGLVHACGEARGRHVVTENSPIHYLCKEGRLRDQLPHHVWDVVLPFRSKRLLVASAATERDYDYFSFRNSGCERKRTRSHQCASGRQPCCIAQELTSAIPQPSTEFARRGRPAQGRLAHF